VQFCNEAKSCAYWLVNETLWYKTKTFDFQSETRSRPRPSHVSTRPRCLETTSQDRLKMSRPRLHPCNTHYMPVWWASISSTRLVNDTRKCYLRYRYGYFLTKLSAISITMQKVSAILLLLLLPILFVLVICDHIFIS